MWRLWIVLFLLGLLGYILNIIAILHTYNIVPLTGLFILRIVGVFAVPLGCILGLFY